MIIRKLEYYKEGGSDKHLRDIRGILNLCHDAVNIDYIEKWADRKGVSDVWRLIHSPET